MLPTNTTHIHGLHTAWANDGLEVRYVFPGALTTSNTPVADVGAERVLTLGVMTADPDGPDGMHVREDRVWRWEARIQPATRIWARHVLAAEMMGRSFSYDHEGQIVLVWTNLPALELELELLRGGFTPALATWRAPDTAAARALASRMEKSPPRPTPRVMSGLMPTELRDDSDHAARAEHAWMRWSARMDNRFLKLGEQIFQYQRQPEQDGSRLILRYVSPTAALQLVLDVARHPLIYDATVVVEKRDGRAERTFPAVAWEDFDNLVAETAKIAEGTPAAKFATKRAAPNLTSRALAGDGADAEAPMAPGAQRQATRPVRQTRTIAGEEIEGQYRRAAIWESVIATVLVDLDLPESLLLYPLVQRLTQAALAVVDEQAAIHGADYLESLRRTGPTQVARLAQLEQRLFDALAEAESFGGLAPLVRQVIGLADGSIRRAPAGTESEIFFRSWIPPDALKLRGRVFNLRRNHVLFETSTVELRYAAAVAPGLATPKLVLTIGLPDRRGLCEIKAHLWYADGGEEAEPWKVTIPHLDKLTGAAIMKQLRPVVAPARTSREQDAAEPWEHLLVAEFNARSEDGPQIRLERRLGSGSRIFVAFIAGSRPEEIVARIDINAAFKIESLVVSEANPALQASLRRGMEAALAVTGERALDDDEVEEQAYAAARKKALAEPPRPALVDRLARHMASQREAAALLELRAQARSDLSAAARTMEAMAAPEGPSPSETTEWFDDHRLPKSAALLSSYIFAPTVDLDTFMADLSESLDHEIGVRHAALVTDRAIEIDRSALRQMNGGTYVLEAAGSSIRPHRVEVLSSDGDVVRIDASKLASGLLRSGEARLYINGAFSDDEITEVRDRYHSLLQSLLRAPIQIEDMRQLIVLAAELVDAPRCQGEAKADAQRALDAARAHYTDARSQLARGRDARALDRLREALRTIVEVAHASAESCAAGQTMLPGFAAVGHVIHQQQ